MAFDKIVNIVSNKNSSSSVGANTSAAKKQVSNTVSKSNSGTNRPGVTNQIRPNSSASLTGSYTKSTNPLRTQYENIWNSGKADKTVPAEAPQSTQTTGGLTESQKEAFKSAGRTRTTNRDLAAGQDWLNQALGLAPTGRRTNNNQITPGRDIKAGQALIDKLSPSSTDEALQVGQQTSEEKRLSSAYNMYINSGGKLWDEMYGVAKPEDANEVLATAMAARNAGKAVTVRVVNGKVEYLYGPDKADPVFYVPLNDNEGSKETSDNLNATNEDYWAKRIVESLEDPNFDPTDDDAIKELDAAASKYAMYLENDEQKAYWQKVHESFQHTLGVNQERRDYLGFFDELQNPNLTVEDAQNLTRRIENQFGNHPEGHEELGITVEQYQQLLSYAQIAMQQATARELRGTADKIAQLEKEVTAADNELATASMADTTFVPSAEEVAAVNAANDKKQSKKKELEELQAEYARQEEEYFQKYMPDDVRAAYERLKAGKPNIAKTGKHKFVGVLGDKGAEDRIHNEDQALVDAYRQSLGLDPMFFTNVARVAGTFEATGKGIESSLLGAARTAYAAMEEGVAQGLAQDETAESWRPRTEAERKVIQEENERAERIDNFWGKGTRATQTTSEAHQHTDRLEEISTRRAEIDARLEELANATDGVGIIPVEIDREIDALNGEDKRLAKEQKQLEKDAKRFSGEESTATKVMTSVVDQLTGEDKETFAKALHGASKYGQMGLKVLRNVTEVGFDTVAGMLVPGGPLAVMATRVFGSESNEARRQGATIGQQVLFGAAKATIEVVTEKLLGGFETIGYGKGWINEGLISDVVSHLGTTPTGLLCLKVIASFVEEGGEEVLSDMLSPLADKIISDKSWRELWEEDTATVLEDFLLGGFMGILGFTSDVASQTIQTGTPLAAVADVYAGDAQAFAAEQGRETGRRLNAMVGEDVVDTNMTPLEQYRLEDAQRRQNYQNGLYDKIYEAETGIKGKANRQNVGKDKRDMFIRNAEREGIDLGSEPSEQESPSAYRDEGELEPMPESPQSSAEYTERVKADAGEVVNKIRAAVQDKTLSPERVSEVSWSDFAKIKPGAKLTEKVGEFFRSLGNKVTSKALGGKDVIIDERSIKDDIAHGVGRAKACTFKAVPDVLANGTIVDEQTNWKDRGYDTKVIAGAISIDGKPAYVGCVVRSINDGNGQRFYLHEVIDGKGNLIYSFDGMPAEIENGPDAAIKTGMNTGAAPEPVTSIPQTAETGNTQNTAQIAPESTQGAEDTETSPEGQATVKPGVKTVKPGERLPSQSASGMIGGNQNGGNANGEALGNASGANRGNDAGVHESADDAGADGANPENGRRAKFAPGSKAREAFDKTVELIRKTNANIKAISYKKYGKALKDIEAWAGERVNFYLADKDGGVCPISEGGEEAGLFALHGRNNGHGGNGVVHEKTHRNIIKHIKNGNADPCANIVQSLSDNNIIGADMLDVVFDKMAVGWGERYLSKTFSPETLNEYKALGSVRERAQFINDHLSAPACAAYHNMIYNEMVCELAANVPGWFDGISAEQFNKAVQSVRSELENLGVYEKGAFNGIDTIIKNANNRLNTLNQKDAEQASRFQKYIRPIEDFDGSEGLYLFEVPAPNDSDRKTLIAVRNMSKSTAEKMLKNGGEAMPSIAVIHPTKAHTSYGEISVIYNPEVVNPDLGAGNRVYSGDAWTPVHPDIRKSNGKLNGYLQELRNDISSAFKGTKFKDAFTYFDNIEDIKHYLTLVEKSGFEPLNEMDTAVKLAVAAEAGYSWDDLVGKQASAQTDENADEKENAYIGHTMLDATGNVWFGDYDVFDINPEFVPFSIPIQDYIDAADFDTFADIYEDKLKLFYEEVVKKDSDPSAPKTYSEYLTWVNNTFKEVSETAEDWLEGEFEDNYTKEDLDLSAAVEKLIPDELAISWLKYKFLGEEDYNSELTLVDPETYEVLPYTLENALNIMRKEPQIGDRAEVRQFSSLSELKAHENNLRDHRTHGHSDYVTKKQMSALTEVEDVLADLADSNQKAVDQFIEKNTTWANDTPQDAVFSFLDKIIRKVAMNPVGYDFDLAILDAISEDLPSLVKENESTGEIQYDARIQSAVNAIKAYVDANYNKPTGYFEAKPDFVVRNNEIVGAILPTGSEYDELANEFEAAEIKVFRADDEASFGQRTRQQTIMKEFPDYLFQTPASADTNSELKALQQENEDLRRQLEELKAQQAGQDQQAPKESPVRNPASSIKPGYRGEGETGPVPPGRIRQIRSAQEAKSQTKGATAFHQQRAKELSKKFDIGDGTYLSMTRDKVSRIADYCISDDGYGLEAEYDRLVNQRDWNRLDYSEADLIIYKMTQDLNNEMARKKNLGKLLERKAGESNFDYRQRQFEENLREYEARREAIDRLSQIYSENKSVLGQELQEQYKFSTADEIIMRANQRFLNYSENGQVQYSDFAKNVKMWRIIDELVKEGRAAETSGNQADIVEFIKKVNRIRGRESMFGRQGIKGEAKLFEEMAKNGVETEALMKMAYGSVNAIMDDLTPMSWADAMQSVRTTNALSAWTSAINNFLNNAVSLRTGAIAQELGSIAAKEFERRTGKIVSFKDKSLFRNKENIRAEITAFAYATLSSYYGLQVDEGRIDIKNHTGGFDPNGSMVERILARYNFFVSATALNPDAPAKARIKAGIEAGLNERFEGVDMTNPENIRNRAELESFKNKEAERRTLQDDNAVTNFVLYARDWLDKRVHTPGGDKMVKGRRLGEFSLGQFVMLFAKVPTNVIMQKIATTPYGAMYHVARYALGLHKARTNPESMTATEMAKLSRDIGRAATTAGMVALGAFAAMSGALKNFDDGDDEEKKLAAEKGYRGLMFNVDAMFRLGSNDWRDGDHIISGRFLEVLAMPLTIGAMCYEASQEGMGILGALNYGTKQSFTQILDAVSEMPGLQQLGDIYQSFSYAKSKEDDADAILKAIGTFAASSATMYYMPNLLVQAGAGFDNTVRDAYTADSYKETLAHIIMSKDPIMRHWLPAKTDSMGNVRRYGSNKGMAMLNTMLLPGDIMTYHKSALEDEFSRLREAGYTTKRFDSKIPKSISANGTDYDLTSDMGIAFHDTKAGYLTEAYTAFMESPEYANLSDDERDAVFKELATNADHETKAGTLKLIDPSATVKMDKWETTLTTMEDRIQYLSAKAQLSTVWDDEDGVTDYAAMDNLIKTVYSKLSEDQKKLLDGSIPYADQMYDASKSGIDSEHWQIMHNLYRKYNAEDEDGKRVYKANLETASEMWAQMKKATGYSDNGREMQWATENLELHYTGSPNTENYEELLTDYGMSRESAAKVYKAFSPLEPTEGYSDVQDRQKWVALTQTNLTDKEKWDTFFALVPSNNTKQIKNMTGLRGAMNPSTLQPYTFEQAIHKLKLDEIYWKEVLPNGKTVKHKIA